MRASCWALIYIVIASGCFAEIGGGFYPSVHQDISAETNPSSSSDGTAWVAMIKIGLFLDIVLDDYGFAVGWAPVGTSLVIPKAPQPAHAGDGHMFRGDFVLPWKLGGSEWGRARVVGEYDYLTGTGVRQPKAESYTDHGIGGGHRLFLGMGLGHTADYGSQLLAIGLQHSSFSTPMFTPTDSSLPVEAAVSTSGWGMAASFTFSLLPAHHPNGITDYSTKTPDTSPGAEACDPWVCDGFGHCTQKCSK